MSPDEFSDGSPGRLVRTEFEEQSLNQGQLQRRRQSGWAFIPDPLPPTLDLGVLLETTYDEVIAAERLLARLDGIASDLPNARLAWAPLSRREAILSSRIEDTIASAEEVAAVEIGEKPERQEVQEVTNYVFALEHGLESDLPLCCRLIKELHGILLRRRVRGHRDMPGQFRTVQNYIGDEQAGFAGAKFVPPPPGEALTKGLADFEQYANRARFGMPKLIAIALMHYQFECLHPFRDGNGRIGRLLIALSMKNLGLLHQPLVYVSGYLEPRRKEYSGLLRRVSTDAAWIDWIRFF